MSIKSFAFPEKNKNFSEKSYSYKGFDNKFCGTTFFVPKTFPNKILIFPTKKNLRISCSGCFCSALVFVFLSDVPKKKNKQKIIYIYIFTNGCCKPIKSTDATYLKIFSFCFNRYTFFFVKFNGYTLTTKN